MPSETFVYMESDSDHVVEKFRQLRLRAGLSMNALAQALGYKGRSSIQRYEDPNLFKKSEIPQDLVRRLLPVLVGKGSPEITAEEVKALGGGLGFGDVSDIHLTALPVLGFVAAGVWLENDATEEKYDPVPIVPDARFPTSAQFGVVVRGTSINELAVEGDVLVCVSMDQTALEPQVGDLVIVRRTRHQGALIETTAKRLQKNGQFELWPVSNDPKHQSPLIIPDDDGNLDELIEVAAIVVGIFKPLR